MPVKVVIFALVLFLVVLFLFNILAGSGMFFRILVSAAIAMGVAYYLNETKFPLLMDEKEEVEYPSEGFANRRAFTEEDGY